MGRNSLFFISKCSEDLIISYAKVYANFCRIMDFTKMFVMSLDFADAKNYRKHVQGNDIQDELSPSTAIFWFVSDKTTYQNKSWCLILGVDRRFIYLHIIVVYRYFHISIWLPKWPPKVTWHFLKKLLVQIQVLCINNILWKFHNNRFNGSGDAVCWTHIPLIFRSVWNMLDTEVLVFWGTWQRKC